MPDSDDTQEMRIFRVEDPFCGKTFALAITEAEYMNWKDGMLLQDAMPSLTENDRELLISGTCPECWDSKIAEPTE